MTELYHLSDQEVPPYCKAVDTLLRTFSGHYILSIEEKFGNKAFPYHVEKFSVTSIDNRNYFDFDESYIEHGLYFLLAIFTRKN